MYKLSRISISNCGHKTAYFRSNLITFISSRTGDVADSVMLYAPNGNGKTTIISMIMHTFVPAKRLFVQHKQKNHHRFEHYISDKRATVFAMELNTKSSDLLGTSKPAVIIGFIAGHKGNDVEEHFFMLRPSADLGFDDLPFVQAAKEGRELEWTYPQALAWLQELGTRTKGKGDLKITQTKSTWQEHLIEQGFSLKSFHAQIEMASSEGGIEKFLEAKSPSEMMEKLLTLILDEDSATARIKRLNEYLVSGTRLPLERTIASNLDILINEEKAFADLIAHAVGQRDALAQQRALAKGAQISMARRIEEMNADLQGLDDEIFAFKNETADLDRRLKQAQVQHEAVRIADVTQKLAAAQQSLEAKNKEKARIELSIKAAENASLWVRAADLERQIGARNEEIEGLRKGDTERLEPLNKAGSALDARIRHDLSSIEASVSNLEADIRQSEHDVTAAANERRLHEREADDVRRALENREATVRQAESVLLALLNEGFTDALLEGASEVQALHKRKLDELENAAANLKRLEASRSDLQRRHDGEERERAETQKRLHASATAVEKAQAELKRFRSACDAIKGGALNDLYPGLDVDPSSQEIMVRIDSEQEALRKRIGEVTASLSRIDDSIRLAEEGGSFDDPDVAQALEMCREHGIEKVGPYANWISQNIPSQDEAKAHVERDPARAIGLRVFDTATRDKIQQAFDREKWMLSKPIVVTVIGEEGEDRETDSLVLSARTDYAYHEPTRQEHLKQLRGRKERLTHEAKSLQERNVRFNSARLAITDFLRTFGSASEQSLVEAVNDAVLIQAELGEELVRADEILAETAAAIAASDEEYALQDAAMAPLSAIVTRLEKAGDKLAELELAIGEVDLVEHEKRLMAAQRGIDDAIGRHDDLQKRKDRLVVEKSILSARHAGLREQLGRIEHKHPERCDEVDLSVSLDALVAEYEHRKEAYLRDKSANDELRVAEIALKGLQEQLRATEGDKTEVLQRLDVDQRDVFAATVEEMVSLSAEERLKRERVLRGELAMVSQDVRTLDGDLAVYKRDRSIKESMLAYADEIKRRSSEMTMSGDEAAEILASIAEEQKSLEEGLRRARYAVDEKKRARDGLFAKLAKAREHHVSLESRLRGVEVVAEHFDLPEAPEQWAGLVDPLLKTMDGLEQSDKAASKAARAKHDMVVGRMKDTGFIIGEEDALRLRFQNFRDHFDHGENLKKVLPGLQNILKAHQSEIQRLEGEEFKIVSDLSVMLGDAIDIVTQAVRKTIPNYGGTFSGKAIVKLQDGIDLKSLKAISTDDVAHEYLQLLRTPGKVNKIDKLCKISSQMLDLVARRLGRQHFELLLLKPVAQARESVYESMHTITGSGGQTITAGLLLNMLANSLRMKDDLSLTCGFIILDNPIGKANLKSLVDIQLQVAKAFGIQLISATGISDKCINAYEWIATFSANRQSKSGNSITVGYDENTVENYHVALKLEGEE